jgi:hypothetical protein
LAFVVPFLGTFLGMQKGATKNSFGHPVRPKNFGEIEAFNKQQALSSASLSFWPRKHARRKQLSLPLTQWKNPALL